MTPFMIRNYFKIAWRNLSRNKAFSVINIAGLALGMTCSLLIMLWVKDERNVDAFHKNGRRLYQVYERQLHDGKIEAGYPTQGLLADELKRVIADVQYACAIDYAAAPGTANTFEADNRVNKISGMYAGADFFRMFSFPILFGKDTSSLIAPGGIAISRRMAEIFFGSAEKAFGKPIRFENRQDLHVTAVFENLPANSSLQFDFLRTWVDYVKENDWVHNWGNTSPNTYVQLFATADPVKTNAAVKDFIYRYQQKARGNTTEVALQPFAGKYLHSSFENGIPAGGRIEYTHLFTVLAIFVLLIACINFMNLATAHSAKRAKEVGLRKVIGATRSSLIAQFIGEAILVCLLSAVIAILLAYTLLPAFNALTGKRLSLPVTQPFSWTILFALVLVTGSVAGSYPALFLSSLRPVRVLKGSLKFKWGTTFFRQGLVVFQFTLSIVLIIGMMVIYRQMNYIQSKNIGYDRGNLVYIPIEGELIKNYGVFRNEAGKIPGVLSISKMRNSPTIIEHHTGSISWPGKDPNQVLSFADAIVGYDFAKTLKLELKEGRDFSRDFGTDSAAFILNETAVKQTGFKNPLGQTVIWGKHQGTVIGVLKDFHFASMHESIEPLIIHLDENWGWGTILVRTQAGKTGEVVDGLKKVYAALNPKFPFTCQFSDQEFTRLYKSEEIVSKLADIFAFLAIFISCLGLFGLATFTAAQRTKEIGVRKVLGASIPDIVAMLSGSFLKPVAIAMLVGFPVAWIVLHKWLQNFAYKIDIEWWVLGFAAVITIGIALLTVSFQSIKAALSNPARSLRTE
jgi:putative ABC transport system permease protein